MKRRPAASSAPSHWAASCTHTECTLHQLSPYIGKLKSVIAHDLIQHYSQPGDLIADTFCGSGTVPLEAARLGRRVFASDSSTYAIALTKAKLEAPTTLRTALDELEELFRHVQTLPLPDVQPVPRWVQSFFHPRTLKETMRLIEVLRSDQQHFFLASTLGILHHQRPGFLSFPSSHLVPYLRSKSFPRDKHPDLYRYRPVEPRLHAKVERALKRPPAITPSRMIEDICHCSVQSLELPRSIDCVITSPPYMNALDYGRDNRLRLWFLNESSPDTLDRALSSLDNFRSMITILSRKLQDRVRPGGHCVFIIGEQVNRTKRQLPSEILIDVITEQAADFRLRHIIQDRIPDIRRSRKYNSGIKTENILVFRKQI